MFAMLQIVALCAAADAAPGYAVHIRELTAPESTVRAPLTHSETVLDAVAALERTPADLSRMDLWVLRPVVGGKSQVLRIDWAGITTRGVVATNYQLLAGDRLFVQSRPAK